tara:strand:+ start:1410 stop:2033 length:624 start_codon:yes stop_codon:yes gene_type:complete
MSDVIFPFGPPIYVSKMGENVLQELDARIEETGGKPEFDASGQLAGRIKKQTHLDDVISDTVKVQILNHCSTFYEKTAGVKIPLESIHLDSIWSNIQEAREYNPIHQHTGNFSFVIYTRNDLEDLSVEELQDNEYDNKIVDHDNQKPLAGLIELFYGEGNWMNWTSFTHVPKRGDILIFPSWLRHTVYAHYETGKIRISVAGNVSFK